LSILVVDVALKDRKVAGRNRSTEKEGWLLDAPSYKRIYIVPDFMRVL